MLHALLHRKLDESISEPQRLEDALTSTVFGTLVLVGAWEILARWLRVSFVAAAGPGSAIRECWFWPRMEGVEPDVLLRLGDALVLVEAKYRSGRHDLAASDVEDRPRDQLVRQYLSLTTPRASRGRYAEPVERAISECALHQVFVVDARRILQARREFEESKKQAGANPCLELVTWQSLFRLIGQPGQPFPRWAVELRAYLEQVGLDTFQGIGPCLGQSAGMRLVFHWRAGRAAPGLHQAVLGIAKGASATSLLPWRSKVQPPGRGRRLSAMGWRVIDGSAARAILAWRGRSVHQRGGTG